MEKKYQLTDETREYEGRTLHCIQALKDFRGVKAGGLVGWVQSEHNLSQAGSCRVYDDAIVMDSAFVSGHSVIGGNAIIKSNALVHNTVVDGKAAIGKNGYITDLACYFVVENIGSRYDTITFYLDKERNIWVNTGCFNDTLEAFKRKVTKTHKENYFAKEYFKAIELAEYKFKYGKIN